MHQRKGLTSIIHGKYEHEETVATVSFCEDYICVKNMKEAEMVADYILNGGDKDAFVKYFEKAVSKNFDPDTMLEKLGLANQTTMYKKETKAVGQLFQKTMMKKFGPSEVNSHYMEFDTICDATQVSQSSPVKCSPDLKNQSRPKEGPPEHGTVRFSPPSPSFSPIHSSINYL
jgi:4-hydroxy-3-methylbut-2-enyl diphosphate reductase